MTRTDVMNEAWRQYRQDYLEPGFYRVGFARCLQRAWKMRHLKPVIITEDERKLISKGS